MKKIKDEVAASKGYPCWEEMESWIIDHNLPANVASLLVAAMSEVVDSSINSISEYIEMLKGQSFEGWNKDAIIGYMTAMNSIGIKVLEMANRT